MSWNRHLRKNGVVARTMALQDAEQHLSAADIRAIRQNEFEQRVIDEHSVTRAELKAWRDEERRERRAAKAAAAAAKRDAEEAAARAQAHAAFIAAMMPQQPPPPTVGPYPLTMNAGFQQAVDRRAVLAAADAIRLENREMRRDAAQNKRRRYEY
jgi:hypothetical protein